MKRVAALVLAVSVIVGALAFAVLPLFLAYRADGVARVVWGCIALLLVWAIAPRVRGVSPSETFLAGDDAPALWRLITLVARATHVPVPHRLAVDLSARTTTTRIGFRQELVVMMSLPEWCALSAKERVGSLAHHLVLADQDRGSRLERIALHILGDAVDLLTAPGRSASARGTVDYADSHFGAIGPGDDLAAWSASREVTRGLGGAVSAGLRWPLTAVASVLRQLSEPMRRSSRHLADSAAATLVGADSVRSWIASSVPPARGSTAAQRAAVSGADPFEAIRADARRSDRELRRALPPEHLARVERLTDIAPEPAELETLLAAAAASDTELTMICRRQAKHYSEGLIWGPPPQPSAPGDL